MPNIFITRTKKSRIIQFKIQGISHRSLSYQFWRSHPYINKIYQIKKETQATQQRVEELQKAKADLEAERKRLDDPKYIEKLAREDHNMVGKNEVPLFIVKDKDKNDAGTTVGFFVAAPYNAALTVTSYAFKKLKSFRKGVIKFGINTQVSPRENSTNGQTYTHKKSVLDL